MNMRMNMRMIEEMYGRHAHNRLADASLAGSEGARAALESFYHAFNQRSQVVLREVWADNPLVQLNNPLGGVIRGVDGVVDLYRRIFEGPADVWVEFHDIVEYTGAGAAVFAGRERGEFRVGDTVIPLDIRTTRVFAYADGRWGQVHHHGSITDPALLAQYQRAVQGGSK